MLLYGYELVKLSIYSVLQCPRGDSGPDATMETARTTVEVDAQNIRALAGIAEIHEH